MDETMRMHNLNLEWGCATNLMDGISKIEDKIEGGWPELIDMVADAVTEEGENKDIASAFFNLYQFLWRLYYRVKANPEKRPFNQISKIMIGGEEVYRVTNYDYQMFKWVKKNAQDDRVTNDYIDIPAGSLNDKQRKAFSRRCE